MSRAARSCAFVAAVLIVTAGCGSTDADRAGTAEDSSGATTLDITFKAGTVAPMGVPLEIDAGEPLELHIVADASGELHVHSSPEREITYPAGTTEQTITLDKPGVVDLESHALDKLIAQIEVR